MLKRLILLGALAGTAVMIPASAQAATLANAGGTLTYTAAPGAANQVGFDQPNPAAKTVEVYRFTGDDDPITPTGCTEEDPGVRYRCTGVNRVVANTADGDDSVDAGGVLAAETQGMEPETILANIPLQANLGTGDDQASGGLANDVVRGGDGNDQILLDGLGFSTSQGGNDQGFGDAGNDSVNGGRGNDTVDGGAGDDVLGGGPGNDTLRGDAGADSLAAGPGAHDTLSGGDGNDTLTGECEQQPCGGGTPGADDVHGDAGFDLFRYETYGPGAITVSLDDVANDGASGEGDNVHSDVEDVLVTGPGKATVTGSPGFNSLTTGGGNDTINAQDGGVDRVSCGAGTDVANVDAADVVNPDCETVNRAAAPSTEDRPPTVAWSAPASGATLSTSSPNTLAVTASDDRGVARVQFLDDERTVCTDTTAPYTCDYTPQGDDVGRNTLVAIAVDTSEQTASAVRTVTVPRFAPRLSAKTSPKRDTRSPYRFTTTGRVTLPAGVTQAEGCRGTVTVQIKAGKKTVSTRRAKLRSNCTYRSRVTFRLKRRLNPRTLKRIARFGGNAVLSPKSATRQTLRVRV